MNFPTRFGAIVTGLLLAAGSSLESLQAYGDSPAPEAAEGASAPAAATQPLEFSAGGFSFPRPLTWQWIPSSSPMRKAELRAETPAGRAEVVFFHFGPGQGGSVQANIERWLGQFVEPVEELGAQTAQEEAGGTRVTLLQAAGTYLAGMPGQQPTPQPGFAMRGAILEHPGGDVYVRMTGPKEAVEVASQDFENMVMRGAETGTRQ
jgi:hypothetical protein